MLYVQEIEVKPKEGFNYRFKYCHLVMHMDLWRGNIIMY